MCTSEGISRTMTENLTRDYWSSFHKPLPPSCPPHIQSPSVRNRRAAAARPLSTLSIAKTHNLLVWLWPLTLSTAANVTAKAGRLSFVLDVIPAPSVLRCCHRRSAPWQPPATNPTKPDKWFRFVLCKRRKKLSIQSSKWCQGFVSKAYEWQKQPTSFHPPSPFSS